MEEEVCFVFYNLKKEIPEEECILPNIDWKCTGSGTTIPFYTKHSTSIEIPSYKYEIQFNGPTEKKETIINVLEKIFQQFQVKGYVENFIIKDFYYPYMY
jgi:hypothetical protein